MGRRGRLKQQVMRIGLSALATTASLQLPILAGTFSSEPPLNPKFGLHHSPRVGKKSIDPKQQFGGIDAWVAKYSPDSTLAWKQQLGTSTDDSSSGVATDSSGNVFILGATQGALGGPFQGSLFDAWVAKYSPDGTLVWKKQLGTSGNDGSFGVATDSRGNVFISGNTFGVLGGSNRGGDDAWVAKYSPDGTLVWKRQLGSSSDDFSRGVATDSRGNVFISGTTDGSLGGPFQGIHDAWVAKYSPNGTLKWKRQLGTSADDSSFSVTTDSSGNVFISGQTGGALGGPFQGGGDDAWVAKYSPNGTLVWKQQLGSSEVDFGLSVTTDSSGNVFISGLTRGALGGPFQGGFDAWVAEYRSDGTLVWKRQLGTSTDDTSSFVATDSSGNVFISGSTFGALGGPNKGVDDAWVTKYSPTHTRLWKRQLGTSSSDGSSSIATDSSGNVFISGYTLGNLGQP